MSEGSTVWPSWSLTIVPSECPHCPHDSSRHRRPSHALPCGHRYCTPALRKVIQTSIQHNNAAPPSCCKCPIPGAMVRRIMTQEEQDDLPSKSTSWDHETGSDHSANETRTNSETMIESERRPRSSKQKFRSIGALEAGQLMQSLDKAMEYSSFKRVWNEQEEQRDRCLELDRDTRERLRQDRDAKIDQAARVHEQQKDDLTEKVVREKYSSPIVSIANNFLAHAEHFTGRGQARPR